MGPLPTRAAVQEFGVDEPLAMLRSGATSFYEADGLGSITSSITPWTSASTIGFGRAGTSLGSTQLTARARGLRPTHASDGFTT